MCQPAVRPHAGLPTFGSMRRGANGRVGGLALLLWTFALGCGLPRDPYQTLEDFQLTVAAAEAWEAIEHIEILEISEDRWTGRRLVDAVRFRRLR